MATASIKTRSIQGESLSAATDRLANTVLLGEGVRDLAGNSYKVAQNTGSDMNVKIGSGTAFDRAVVVGVLAGQGTYICEHQNATQTLAVAASDPTNPRIDIAILRVYDDTFDSSGLDEADLEIITGTPAGSPSAPATPSGAYKLADIAVAAGVTAITNGNITDFRVESPLLQNARLAGPLGILGYTERTADLASIGTGVLDIGTLATTVTVATGRRIRVSAYAILRSGTSATNGSLLIREGSTTLVDTLSNIHLGAGSAQVPWDASVILTPSAGAHTYKLSTNFSVNTNNEVRASTTNPAYILVEDIGPA
jgi:hypothetical protein